MRVKRVMLMSICISLFCLSAGALNVSAEDTQRIPMPDSPQAVIASGTCGKGTSWVLSDDYTLTIQGRGETLDYQYYDYSYTDAPWDQYMDQIKKVVVTGSVTRIGSCAFFHADNLETLELNDSLQEIGFDAFMECPSIKEVVLPASLTKLEYGVFSNCTGLEKIVFPDSLITLEEGICSGCTSLNNVTLPSRLETIRFGAFEKCASLASIELPDGLKTIKDTVFAESGLTEITVPASVEELGIRVFSSCSQLEKAVINAEGIVDLHMGLFRYCTKLKEVWLMMPACYKIASDVFMMDKALADIYFSRCPEDWDNITILPQDESSFDTAKIHFLDTEKKWTWSSDNKTAQFALHCKTHNKDEVSVQATVTSKRTEPSCDFNGNITFTAEAVYKNLTYTDTKKKILRATGHKYGNPEYTWASDNSTVTAKAVCENNSKHTVTETVQTTYKIITKPTTEKAGKAEFRAVFKNELFETQKKTVILPKKKGRKMFRLYNPNTGEHFYTAKDGEKAFLVKAGWKDEGSGWNAPETSSTPVYRLYNSNTGEHHYTTNAKEKDALVKFGWTDEGIGWYSDDEKGVPLYREYNPNMPACNHNYTANKKEHDYLVSHGWNDEGIGWYGQE